MYDIVTIGWLTIDDIVLQDSTYLKSVLGGGALYSAVGAFIWNKNVGIKTVTGAKYIDFAEKAIKDFGFIGCDISTIPGNGLELWLLHESGTIKQQVPKIGSSTAEQMDLGRSDISGDFINASGFHIAPQTPDGSLKNIQQISKLTAQSTTMDILADSYVDAKKYTDLKFLDALSAFLPSIEEVNILWNPPDLFSWLKDTAKIKNCILGVKLGSKGSILCDPQTSKIYEVPVFPSQALDTTGAGDAYCGGFLAGLVAKKNVLECAAMATVSASYVVENSGALNTIIPTDSERELRLEYVMEKSVAYG
ncbi:MAG: carbohydrate kinase family protein [Spirochaetaceae bacterium]|nr:carbohydrate kinase family protein [Spirochaetaceae bacterium]